MVKGHLRLASVQVGVRRRLNDVQVRMNDIRVGWRMVVRVRVLRVRRVGVLAELPVETSAGILVVRSQS